MQRKQGNGLRSLKEWQSQRKECLRNYRAQIPGKFCTCITLTYKGSGEIRPDHFEVHGKAKAVRSGGTGKIWCLVKFTQFNTKITKNIYTFQYQIVTHVNTKIIGTENAQHLHNLLGAYQVPLVQWRKHFLTGNNMINRERRSFEGVEKVSKVLTKKHHYRSF